MSIGVQIVKPGSVAANISCGSGGGNTLVAFLTPLIKGVQSRHGDRKSLDRIVSCQFDRFTGLQCSRNTSPSYYQAAAVDGDERRVPAGIHVGAVSARSEKSQSSIGRVHLDGITGRHLIDTDPESALF
jgi:hypothetical protein